jgi:hypothetical protein
MSCPLTQDQLLHLVFPLYIINLLEVEGVGVFPAVLPAYLVPALYMFDLLSVVFSSSLIDLS